MTNYGTLESAEDLIEDPLIVENRGILQRIWKRIFPYGYKDEFLELFRLAWPAILTSFFRYVLLSESIIICGHIGKLEMDAASLANSFINVFGMSIGMGLSTACDTLFSQTYGSTNKKRMGMYLQRSLMIMTSTFAILACLHINIEPVLLLLNQDPEVARMAAEYMVIFLPGLLGDFIFLTFARYLQNQNIVYPPMICGLIGNIVNIISQYVCIFVYNKSYLASAACQAVSCWIMLIIELIYIKVFKVYVHTWDGFQLLEALGDWGLFMKLGVPGILLIALEEWSFEIGTIIAGTLDTVQLGAQSVIFQLEALTFMIPFGLSVAINIRVGQQLGSNEHLGAVTTYRVGLSMITCTATTVALVLISAKDYIPMLFTVDKDIQRESAKIVGILALFQYCDGLAAISSGALRGCGRQMIGAVLIFFGYYVFSLPLGISLTLLTDLKMLGMWIGLALGIGIQAIAFMIVVIMTDWKKQAHIAQVVAYGPDYKVTDKTLFEIKNEEEQQDETAGLVRRSRSLTRSLSKTRYSGRFLSGDRDTVGRLLSHERPTANVRSLLFRRILFLVFLVCLLGGAVILRIYTPRTWIAPSNATTTIEPFSNVTLI